MIGRGQAAKRPIGPAAPLSPNRAQPPGDDPPLAGGRGARLLLFFEILILYDDMRVSVIPLPMCAIPPHSESLISFQSSTVKETVRRRKGVDWPLAARPHLLFSIPQCRMLACGIEVNFCPNPTFPHPGSAKAGTGLAGNNLNAAMQAK